jgi:hypothetical protein
MDSFSRVAVGGLGYIGLLTAAVCQCRLKFASPANCVPLGVVL